jgi:two-component sensor histidine kinase
MYKLVLLLFLLTYSAAVCRSQNTQGGLAVIREKETSTASVTDGINKSGPDTSKVNLLNKLAHIYWTKKTIANHGLDSSFIAANQAYSLSRALKFISGSNEALFMMCRVHVEKNNFTEALKLTDLVYGEQLARLCLTIAERYVFHFNSGEKEFFKALPLIEKAKKASIKSLKWSIESTTLLAKFHFKQGNIAAGKQDFMSIIMKYHRLKDYANEAQYWQELGHYMPDNKETFAEKINSQEMSVKYYLMAGKKKEAGYSLRDLATTRANHNQVAQAERDIIHMLELFKSTHTPLTIASLGFLSDYYRFAGKYDKALHYGFAGLKAAGDDIGKKIYPSTALGITYALLNDYPNAIKYHQLAYDYAVERNSTSMYSAANRLSYTLAEGGNPKKALSFLNQFLKEHPTASANHQQLFASDYGIIYNLLGNYALAEKYYLKMLSLEEQVNQENGKSLAIDIDATLVGGTAFFVAGNFYAERRRYQEAKKHLLKSLDKLHSFSKAREIQTYHLLYQVEFALGNYHAAIIHLLKNKELSDSVNSVARVNQIAELNIRYESEQKAKEIKFLEKNQHLQQLAIQRSDTIRNVTLCGAALFLLLGISAYVGYRIKQKSNRQLRDQQEEINRQNAVLQSLLSEKEKFLLEKDNLIEEKDSLLKDKDWLLKEVHHRVKNNLQIIMSLLRTQLSHLKNEDARQAIIESEGRVQAISLIHQKLYNTDKMASISMTSYVADLVHYLSNGLNTGDKKIRFTEYIDDIHIGLAQAVPIGLILNEAITNAIKYGDNGEGVDISINLKRLEGTVTALTITDTGKGLPADFDLISTKSLGMQMMKGLTNQLKGHFNISSAGGVTVSVQFQT